MRARSAVLPLAMAMSVFGQGGPHHSGAAHPGAVHGGAANGATASPSAGKGQSFNVRRTIPTNAFGLRSTGGYLYGYPLYPGGADNAYAAPEPVAAPQETAPPPRVTPLMFEVGPEGGSARTEEGRGVITNYPEAGRRETATEPENAAGPARYLLAFKDRTVCPATAYWVDGGTLHYVTAGNVQHQASLGSIDRGLTERLNRDLGVDFTLPAAQ